MNAKRMEELGSPHTRQSTSCPQSAKKLASCASLTASLMSLQVVRGACCGGRDSGGCRSRKCEWWVHARATDKTKDGLRHSGPSPPPPRPSPDVNCAPHFLLVSSPAAAATAPPTQRAPLLLLLLCHGCRSHGGGSAAGRQACRHEAVRQLHLRHCTTTQLQLRK